MKHLMALYGSKIASIAEDGGIRFIREPVRPDARYAHVSNMMNARAPFRRNPLEYGQAAPGRRPRRNFDDPATTRQRSASPFERFFSPCRALPGRRVVMLLLPCLMLSLVLAALYAVKPGGGPYGPRARLEVNLETLSADSLPLGLDTFFPLSMAEASSFSEAGPETGQGDLFSSYYSEDGSFVVRGEASADAFARARSGPLPFEEGQRGLVRFSRGRVSIDTVDGAVPVSRLRQSAVPAMAEAPDMFQTNMFAASRFYGGKSLTPFLAGEETDDKGLPGRWSRPDGEAPSGILVCTEGGSRTQAMLRSIIRGLSVPAPGANFAAQAGRYRTLVSRYAERFDLATSLVLAIMHTESNFNPFAVSASQAVGLMQIVPDTAGHEVHRYLTGVQGAPSPETLFSPEHNIRYGTAYLHLLGRRYFGAVTNLSSRQMCMIAAYNGGPGAVLRLFDATDQDSAVARINAMSPEEVYKALTTDMPNVETRRYVDLVLARMRSYAVY